MNTDKQNIIDQLLNIGFVEDDANTGTYEFYDEKKLITYTFIDNDNLVNLEDHQIKQLCEQCKLTTAEFEKLSNGKLKTERYLKILQKQKAV